MESCNRSTLRIGRENVILCRYPRVALVPAFGAAWIKLGRLERFGRWIVSPLGKRPAVRIRKSLGVLFDERERFQGVRHHHEIRGHSVPFDGPLDFRNLGTL